MSTTDDNPGADSPGPHPDLRSLDRLVGTWSLSGDTDGTVTYEWMAGGYFLLQHVDRVLYGHAVQGMEVIGHWRQWGEGASGDILSRTYDAAGNTFDYVYEVDEHTLAIWAGVRNAPSFYRGEFSADGRTNAGAWVYEGGGGYASTMTRKD